LRSFFEKTRSEKNNRPGTNPANGKGFTMKKIAVPAVAAAFIIGIVIGALGCYIVMEKNQSGFMKGAKNTENLFTGK